MRSSRDPWLPAILVVSASLGLFHLNWGLPNGNASWAADAPGPLTVLNICWRQLREFNSGWFWYKYPFGYPLLLAIAYAPYLAWVWLTGGLHGFSTRFPYGLEEPDHVLYVLAVIGRCVNLLLITATVAITYGIGTRLLGRRVGRLAAWFTATAYPLVYYAHTTNQDAAYLCWLLFALWAALVAAQEGRRWAYVLLGFAAGMAMATKEQGFAWLLVLPLLLIAGAYQRQPGWHAPWRRVWHAAFNTDTLAGLAASVVTFAVASNAIVNPLGLWNRLQDLSGTPIPGLSARLTPIKFSLFKGLAKETLYIRQVVDVLESSVGLAVFAVALVGVVYLVVRRRRAAAWLLVPAAAYYLVSLRTHDLLVLRYTLPLMPILALLAAAVCSAVWDARPRLGMVLAAGLCVVALGRAVELGSLLVHDPRYAAERWMHENAAAGSSVEVYQKLAYLPRLNGYQLRAVPIAERSIDKFLERKPDYLIISSAGRKQVTHIWNLDWQQAGSLLGEDAEAARFLKALEGGELPYRVVAHVSAPPPELIRLRITSINPQIWIYARQSS